MSAIISFKKIGNYCFQNVSNKNLQNVNNYYFQHVKTFIFSKMLIIILFIINFKSVYIRGFMADVHIRGFMAAKNHNSESADNTIIFTIPAIIEYELQAKPSILYRPIVFFDAARDDNDNYNLWNFNCKFFIGRFSIICFLRPQMLLCGHF